MRHSHGVAAGVLLAASLLVTPVSAQSLLGGGAGNDGSLVTLRGGEADTSGAVNAGVGGGNGNILDLNLFPGSNGSTAAANVGTGGDDPLDAELRLFGGDVRVDAGAGGGNLATVDVGLGGAGGNGDPGTPGVPAAPGAGGANGNGAATGLAAACAGQDASGIANLIASTDYSQQALMQWRNARGVEIVPVQFCGDIVNQLRGLAQASNIGFLQNLVANDVLLDAALSRSSKGAGDILAIDYRNRMLTVYVL